MFVGVYKGGPVCSSKTGKHALQTRVGILTPESPNASPDHHTTAHDHGDARSQDGLQPILRVLHEAPSTLIAEKKQASPRVSPEPDGVLRLPLRALQTRVGILTPCLLYTSPSPRD